MISGVFAGGALFGAASAAVTSAKRLQGALQALGKTVKDSVLIAIKVDGALGAKTVIGVNRAFTKHLGSGQAPANYRTGKLTLAQVKAAPDALAALLEAEVKRRGGSLVAVTPAAKAAAKTTAKVKTVAKKAAVKAATKAVTKKPSTKVAKKVGTPKLVKTASGKTVQTQQVITDEGNAAVEVTDPETGTTVVSVAPPPPPSVAVKAAQAAAQEAAQEATDAGMDPAQVAKTAATAATQAAQMVDTAITETPTANAFSPTTALVPSSDGDSFFNRNKYLLLGGVGIALISGILLLKKKKLATA